MPDTESNIKIEPQLSAIEARVLGSLLEKQLATPDVYPLTLNSLVLACNQKTSREPVSHYSSGDVQHCLRQLSDRKIVDIDYGSRAERYAQRLTRILGVDKRMQALMALLLLRGPQTVNELFTRTQRMAEFSSDAEVEEMLEHFAEKTQPMVQRIARQAGQREDRFVQLLTGVPDVTAIAKMVVKENAEPSVCSIEQRLAALEKQVVDLQQQLNSVLDDGR